jgi:hypothetical protein
VEHYLRPQALTTWAEMLWRPSACAGLPALPALACKALGGRARHSVRAVEFREDTRA